MSQAQLFPVQALYPCVFSPCGKYRYLLRDPHGPGKGVCLWILANPSVGNQSQLDNTLRRCEDYSWRWGFAEMRVVNVRAWASTDPKQVPADPLAIGPYNDSVIIEQASQAQLVVCGWGKLGGARGPLVKRLIEPYCVPHALKLNDSDGSPAHPLYLAKALKPFPLSEVA